MCSARKNEIGRFPKLKISKRGMGGGVVEKIIERTFFFASRNFLKHIKLTIFKNSKERPLSFRRRGKRQCLSGSTGMPLAFLPSPIPSKNRRPRRSNICTSLG